MGQRRDAEIEAWQKMAGLRPSPHWNLLDAMSNKAFELIKVIQLEMSGIRDGDGCWSGSDAMGGIARDLVKTIEEWEAAERRQYEAAQAGQVNFFDGDVPF
jgi:hypothetical protein